MNRITHKFNELKALQKKALVAYLTAGDPDYATSLKVILAACDAGVDVIELGVPFSDPTADGQVIQDASLRALAKGMNIELCFKMAKEIRQHNKTIPMVLFSYYNPLFQYSPKDLYDRCMDSGIDALLVVDLPPEEATELTNQFPNPQALPMIRLVAPTTPLARKESIAKDAGGFLYLITRTGVTGSGGLDVERIAKHAGELRSKSPVPVCLGFGISTPEDIRTLSPYADGLVVGSALVKIVAQYGQDPSLLTRISQAVKDLKAAC